MPKNNSKARRKIRRQVAALNAAFPQIFCLDCGSTHRDTRPCHIREA